MGILFPKPMPYVAIPECICVKTIKIKLVILDVPILDFSFYTGLWHTTNQKLNKCKVISSLIRSPFICVPSIPCGVFCTIHTLYQSGTLPFSVALRELPYTVTLFDRATEYGSSGH